MALREGCMYGKCYDYHIVDSTWIGQIAEAFRTMLSYLVCSKVRRVGWYIKIVVELQIGVNFGRKIVLWLGWGIHSKANWVGVGLG